MKKHRSFSVIFSAFMVVSLMTVFAIPSEAAWKYNSVGWWYENPDGSWPKNAWQWIDGNGDGIYECYAFNAQGYMYQNTTTPDGYTVGPSGAWMTNGLPATRAFLGGAVPAPTPISTYSYSNASSSGSTTAASSKKTTTSSSSSAATTRDAVTDADIVKSVVSNKSSTNSDSSSETTSSSTSKQENDVENSGPDLSQTSNSSFGPSAGSGSGKNIGPSADLSDHGSPGSNSKIVEVQSR